MLSHRTFPSIWVLVLLLPASPGVHAAERGQTQERALRVPVRLTAGSSNQLMGVLSPNEQALYFISDRNATAEVFCQDPVDSGPRLLFESNADVSWPRLSPDGKWLAYISYKSDAAGDLCVMDLKLKEHRCLTGLDSSELQLLWMGNQRLAALVRPDLHADYELRVFDPSKKGPGQSVLARNMLGPALAADGKWLAYVPVVPTAKQVGVSFSSRSTQGLGFWRLGESSQAVAYQPDLPGLTGFPAFSLDGRYLYFSQYLNDTNRDGVIDGDDNSILFRIPFQAGAKNPVAKAFPEQLTSAQWNCRYPRPSARWLVSTCSHQGSLDIYRLPLDGAVPSSWKPKRIRAELHSARNHWTRLLLLARLLTVEKRPSQDIEVLRNMVAAHIELGEYESALYYCDQIVRLAGKQHATAGTWAQVMRKLAEHRREDIALTHGQLSDRYIQSESKRAQATEELFDKLTPQVQALAQLVVSEIQNDIGRKREASESFQRVHPGALSDPLVLKLFADRGTIIYEQTGDREALLSLYAGLADHPALSVLDHMRYAKHFVRELGRGMLIADRPALLADRISNTKADSELGIMLRVTALLSSLNQENQDQVRREIFGIYKKHKDTDRRRAIVLETIKTAARLGNEYLQYQFATSWASMLKRAEPERKYAEALYQQIVLERAYTELSKKQIKGARGHFYATTLRTDSAEAHIGFIEAWLQEGRGDVVPTYTKRYAKEPNHPMWAFVQAYLIARALPTTDPLPVFANQVSAAIKLLKQASAAYPRSTEVHHLWGYLLHQRFLRSHDKQDASSANSHYLLALDLARTNPRYRAALLQQTGLLQASLGNHRIALKHFAQRQRLPQVRPEAELNLKLAMARSHFHIDEIEQALRLGKNALAMTRGSHQQLAVYQPLVMDRLAFYRQSAGDPAGALELYRQVLALVDAADAGDIGIPINRLKARLGIVSSALALKDYVLAIKRISEIDGILASSDLLRPEIPAGQRSILDQYHFDQPDYQILSAGLLAQAQRARKDYPGATTAMQHRYDLLHTRFKDTDSDETLLELARASHHLGEYAYRLGKLDQARVHLERGLTQANTYNQRTGSSVNPVGLRLLQAYAELHLYGHLDLGRFTLDLKKELALSYQFICEHPSPNWQADRFVFGIYLAMLKLSETNLKGGI